MKDNLDPDSALGKMPVESERLETGYFTLESIEHIHRYALAAALVRPGTKILDAASGDGYGSAMLASYGGLVTGCDVSELAVQAARKKYEESGATFVVGDVCDMPFEDSSFDLVVSFETIEHHDRHDEMLKEISRVLKPDGLLLISSPDKKYYSDVPGFSNPFHVKELYFKEFDVLLRRWFPCVNYLHQKPVYGSMVWSDRFGSEIFELRGGFSGFTSDERLQSPLYHIAIASRTNYVGELGCRQSYFDGWGAFEVERRWRERQHQAEVDAYRNSFSYKLGRALLTPLRSILGRR